MLLTPCAIHRRAGAPWRLPPIATAKALSTSPCAITAREFQKRFASDFSSNFSPPKMRVWEWALPLCVQLPRRMAEPLRAKTPMEAERVFIFVCLSLRRCHIMINPNVMVFVIDDDESVRKSLKRLLDAAHYKAGVFKSASEFLSRSAYPGA